MVACAKRVTDVSLLHLLRLRRHIRFSTSFSSTMKFLIKKTSFQALDDDVESVAPVNAKKDTGLPAVSMSLHQAASDTRRVRRTRSNRADTRPPASDSHSPKSKKSTVRKPGQLMDDIDLFNSDSLDLTDVLTEATKVDVDCNFGNESSRTCSMEDDQLEEEAIAAGIAVQRKQKRSSKSPKREKSASPEFGTTWVSAPNSRKAHLEISFTDRVEPKVDRRNAVILKKGARAA